MSSSSFVFMSAALHMELFHTLTFCIRCPYTVITELSICTKAPKNLKEPDHCSAFPTKGNIIEKLK